MARIFIKNADGSPSAYEIDRALSIGRHPGNAIVLDHISVSGHHAELSIHEGACLLKDLLSSNGTYVNGEKIMVHQLNDGDQIRFGKVDAVVSIDATPGPPAHTVPPPFLNRTAG